MTINIPLEFYHLSTQDHIRYINTMTGGAYNVFRAMLFLPAWALPFSRQLKPRKLILSDYAAMDWSVDKIKALQEALAQLMDLGFEIYIEEYKKTKPLLKEDLPELSRDRLRRRMNPCFPQELIDTAVKQHRLSADELFVLDHDWIKVLLDELPINSPKELSLSEFYHLNSENREKLIKVLQEGSPKVETIHQDEFPVPIEKLKVFSKGKGQSAFPDYQVRY